MRTATTPETAPSRTGPGTTAKSPSVGLEHRVRERERERLHDDRRGRRHPPPQRPEQQPAEQQLLADGRDERGDDREHRELGAARLVEVVDDRLVLVARCARAARSSTEPTTNRPSPANGAHQSRSCSVSPKSARSVPRPLAPATQHADRRTRRRTGPERRRPVGERRRCDRRVSPVIAKPIARAPTTDATMPAT